LGELYSHSPRTIEPQPFYVLHTFSLPPEWYFDSEEFILTWVLEKIFLVEQHEAMEFLKYKGRAPFFPDHEKDPYSVVFKPKES
jgi:hypothetical protein